MGRCGVVIKVGFRGGFWGKITTTSVKNMTFFVNVAIGWSEWLWSGDGRRIERFGREKA